MKRSAILPCVFTLILINIPYAIAESEDSFRCGPMGGKSLVQLGCTEDYVVRSCGEPQSKYSDDWIYDLGKGDFVYTLRFRRGRLVSIDRGDRSRGRTYQFNPPSQQQPKTAMSNSAAIKDVDHIRVSAYDEDGVLRISVTYLNRDRDKLVFWEEGLAKCVCRCYKNAGNTLHPQKGDFIEDVFKDVTRYDQDFYLDIPPKYRGKGIWGIIDCEVDTRHHRMHATENFKIK